MPPLPAEEGHGTWRGYRKLRCRCDACLAWQRGRRKKPKDIDDLSKQRPMSMAEKIAEIEFLGSTDTVDNLAHRLDWATVWDMNTALRRKGRHDLADSLLARRRTEVKHNEPYQSFG